MAKKPSKSMSAEQVAQKAKPNWKPVPAEAADPASDRYRKAEPDAQTPELDALYRKYFGAQAEDARRARKAAPPKQSKLVMMEPKNASDARRVGRKVVLVEDGEVIGEQG